MSGGDNRILPAPECPPWLVYPRELLNLARGGRGTLGDWRLCDATSVRWDMVRLKESLGRELVPFAQQKDGEVLACFEQGRGQEVIVLRHTQGAGWRDEGRYVSFATWLDAVGQRPSGQRSLLGHGAEASAFDELELQ